MSWLEATIQEDIEKKYEEERQICFCILLIGMIIGLNVGVILGSLA